MMARVARMKGIAVLSALSFLRETHGAEACDAVLGELNAEAQARIRTSCREASWHPVEDLTALMEIARRRLAPDDPEFLRKLGRYPTECLARIRGFPATRALCQRFTGALEGLLSTATLEASTREEACVALGDELCVLRIVWE